MLLISKKKRLSYHSYRDGWIDVSRLRFAWLLLANENVFNNETQTQNALLVGHCSEMQTSPIGEPNDDTFWEEERGQAKKKILGRGGAPGDLGRWGQRRRDSSHEELGRLDVDGGT
jgi:hypothetical protein